MAGRDPIRVLLVSPCFGSYGGIEAFVFAVAGAVMRDARFDLRVVFKRTSRFELQPALERISRSYPVEFCDRASPRLWSHIGWADVVHAQNAPPDVAAVASLLRRPLAVTIHDFLPASPRLRRLSWQFGARAASVRWYNSTPVWQSWETGQPRGGSARVPTASQLPAAFVEPPARKGFLYIGRLVDSKGVDILIDAYTSSGLNPEAWPLTIAGDGPLRAALEARGARIPGIRFLGFVDDDRKASLMASAKWVVVPSHAHEGLGLVAIEARHVGVPCIITRHGGLPEAGGRDALVCDPHDVPSLAAALRMAAVMNAEEYEDRSTRTKADLTREVVPLTFYLDAYFRLANGGRMPQAS